MTLNHILKHEKVLNENIRTFYLVKIIYYILLFRPRFKGKRWINRIPSHIEAANAESKEDQFKRLLRIGRKEEMQIIDPINGLHFWHWTQPEDPFVFLYIYVFAQDKKTAIRAYSFNRMNNYVVARKSTLTLEQRKAEYRQAQKFMQEHLESSSPFPEWYNEEGEED